MAKAEPTVEELVSKIERGELQEPIDRVRAAKASQVGETGPMQTEQIGLAL